MSREEINEKLDLIEKNMKVIEAYDKLYQQMKEVDEIIKEGEGE